MSFTLFFAIILVFIPIKASTKNRQKSNTLTEIYKDSQWLPFTTRISYESTAL